MVWSPALAAGLLAWCSFGAPTHWSRFHLLAIGLAIAVGWAYPYAQSLRYKLPMSLKLVRGLEASEAGLHILANHSEGYRFEWADLAGHSEGRSILAFFFRSGTSCIVPKDALSREQLQQLISLSGSQVSF